MTVTARNSSGGVDIELELERDRLLPGRLVDGSVRLGFHRNLEVRGVFATLIGTEWWQHERTTTDSNGHTKTEIVTSRAELPRVPVQLTGATSFAQGETRTLPFQMPVPGLGPPTVQATVCGAEWELEVKLDVPGASDPRLSLPVVILQPTALLRAGAVSVGQFALWPEADIEQMRAMATPKGSIWLDPVPLCLGQSFSGRLRVEIEKPMKLQEVRLELRVRAWSTVSSPRSEEITIWSDRLAHAGELTDGAQQTEFSGELPATWLPTARLPHGHTSATFRCVLARAWAPDPNLVREVALCSTTEL